MALRMNDSLFWIILRETVTSIPLPDVPAKKKISYRTDRWGKPLKISYETTDGLLVSKQTFILLCAEMTIMNVLTRAVFDRLLMQYV